MRKTPALTTATAWSSADTGVGATIAAGSQKCTGMTAALAMPKTNKASSSPRATGVSLPARMPPAWKSSVPAAMPVQAMAGRSSSVEVPSSISR